MLLQLLNFFEEVTGEENPGGGASGGSGGSFWDSLAKNWWMYLILVLVRVGFVVYTVLSQRKQKKRTQEMMSNLVIGNIVTTIGGIVGEIVEIDDKHIWLLTGTEGNKTTMQFLRQAVHSVAPAPGSPEAEAQAKAEKEKADEIDEIK